MQASVLTTIPKKQLQKKALSYTKTQRHEAHTAFMMLGLYFLY